MKVLAQVNALEARISINEDTGDYELDLKLELSDGSEKQVTKVLSQPCFRLELASKEEGEETSSN